MMEGREGKPLKIYRASAGSGKTFTLTVEYITLLMVNPMEYRNILAVTFTNKATAEMRRRILGTLYGIGHGLEGAAAYEERILANLEEMRATDGRLDEEERAVLRRIDRGVLRERARMALANIVHDYSRFRVVTIDSFFQGVIGDLASELELSARMKIELDETGVLSDAVDEIIDNLSEGSGEFRSVVDFVEERIRCNRSWRVGEAVKDFGRNIFRESYLVHGEDVRKRMTDDGATKRYRDAINAYLEKRRGAVADMGARLLAAYEQGGMTDGDGSKAIVTFFEKVRDGHIVEPGGRSKGTFSDSIAEYRTNVDKWFKKSAKNRDRLQGHVREVLMPMLAETFEVFHQYLCHAHTVDAITQHLFNLMLLGQIGEKVKTLNHENNRFLLAETANFLRNVITGQDIPFVYEKTGAVVKHVMIDEFQDTSALQWDNFKPLILNSLAMGGSCLIVGDVKQSIYRFRNSDWRILTGIGNERELQGSIREIPAEYNFRSSRRIVDFNNDLFERAVGMLKASCATLDTAYGDVRQTPRREEDEGFVRIENIDYHGIDKDHLSEKWEKQTSPQYEEAMMQRIQLSVKELMANGVSANDITILVRYNREVPLISEYFNNHQEILNVKIVSDDAFRLDASPSINLIICALRALSAQNDRLHLATLAYYYQTAVLGNTRVQENPALLFSREKIEEIDEFLPAAFRRQERQRLQFKSLTELSEDIYQIFLLDRIAHQDAYLFFFNDIVGNFGEEHLTDIDTFLLSWDEKLHEMTIPNGTSDGVRMMTMHKSKGLEFHTVIIPFCSWSIKPNDHDIMWCVPQVAPYNLMPLLPISVQKAKDDSIFVDDRREEELKTLVDNINVLYVAFTRAKHNLLIFTGNKIGEKDETETGERNADAPTIRSAQSFLVKAMPDYMTTYDHEDLVTGYQYGAIVPTKAKKEKSQENVMENDYTPQPVSFTSYPSVATFRQSYASDIFITADSLMPKVQQHAEHIRLISLGNLYHNVFQLINTIDDVPHAVQLLASKGCFGTLLDAAAVEKTVTDLIRSITPQHPEWFSPEWKVLNERAILYLEDGSPTTKRPDRVVVRQHQAIIIDYKTAQGVVKPKADGTFVAPPENRLQIQNYKRLLTQMGYTDVQAFLWYILDAVVVAV